MCCLSSVTRILLHNRLHVCFHTFEGVTACDSSDQARIVKGTASGALLNILQTGHQSTPVWSTPLLSTFALAPGFAETDASDQFREWAITSQSTLLHPHQA